MLGNGVIGIQREVYSKWERRAPLSPSHCAHLLRSNGVKRIIVQPCTKRIYHDIQYQNVGCEILEDLSDCGLILGVKQPHSGTLLADRAYAFFSHTHKAEPQNMPILDEVLSKRVSLYDYELIVDEKGERLVAFGEYAGMAGMIDFLRGLGERYLSLGYSTPFLSLGSSYMYPSLSAAKAAVIAAGDEIRSAGLPLAIAPLVFVFTGSGNVSRGAQEIFRLLPHSFIMPSELSQVSDSVFEMEVTSLPKPGRGRGNFQVYGCVVTSENMVEPIDPTKSFEKADYYAHPSQYHSVFHEKVAPYASAIVNCIYWERRFPRLLTKEQFQVLTNNGTDSFAARRLVGIADITCDLGGSIEFVDRTTSFEKPFFRYDPSSDSYHDDLNGEGVIVLAIDNLPTELAKEATNHFGEVLCCFLPCMVNHSNLDDMLMPIRRACIAHNGKLTSLYEYIHRMRQSKIIETSLMEKADNIRHGQFKTVVSLNGHLFDKFLINEALDVIEEAGGQFRLATCELGQTADAMSYAELEVRADSEEVLSRILDSLAAVASHSDRNSGESQSSLNKYNTRKSFSYSEKKMGDADFQMKDLFHQHEGLHILILGAGRVCEPAVRYLAFNGVKLKQSHNWMNLTSPVRNQRDEQVWITVASLFLQDAQKVVEGIPNALAIQLDTEDNQNLRLWISKASVVISLLPPSCHITVAKACIEMRRHLVTASYVSKEMSALDAVAKNSGITILCEMGLDPGIDHMMAMKMINSAHSGGGSINSFVSYCGGLPSPSAANNPLGYKFSWNPSGALKAGRNPAVYKLNNHCINVAGENLFRSAIPFRLPNLPAFALERLPNRDSLIYGDLYGISSEASTILRATLRYEGYSEIMNCFAMLGFFSTETYPLLKAEICLPSEKPTYSRLLDSLLSRFSEDQTQMNGDLTITPTVCTLTAKLLKSGICKDTFVAKKICKCIRMLELDLDEPIPQACQSAFDVFCLQMEKKLSLAPTEQDMVLLHHEMEVIYKDNRLPESHSATLLAFGESHYHGKDLAMKPQSAMARTVGLPAAIGAQLLLAGEIKMRGVLLPIEPEIYLPVMKILESSGLHVEEHVDVM